MEFAQMIGSFTQLQREMPHAQQPILATAAAAAAADPSSSLQKPY